MSTRTRASAAEPLVTCTLRHLQAEVLHVAAPAQLDADDQLDRLERRHFLEEPARRQLDQRLGVFGHSAAPSGARRVRSCGAAAACVRSPCAGSPRCPRRSAAAARRGTGARSRTPWSSRSRRGCAGDSSTQKRPASEANSLAMPASRSERSPASFSRAARSVSRRAASTCGGHVGELELDRLVLCDRLAEGLALLRVAQRRARARAGRCRRHGRRR